jgi:hypothetical protein
MRFSVMLAEEYIQLFPFAYHLQSVVVMCNPIRHLPLFKSAGQDFK